MMGLNLTTCLRLESAACSSMLTVEGLIDGIHGAKHHVRFHALNIDLDKPAHWNPTNPELKIGKHLARGIVTA